MKAMTNDQLLRLLRIVEDEALGRAEEQLDELVDNINTTEDSPATSELLESASSTIARVRSDLRQLMRMLR